MGQVGVYTRRRLRPFFYTVYYIYYIYTGLRRYDYPLCLRLYRDYYCPGVYRTSVAVLDGWRSHVELLLLWPADRQGAQRCQLATASLKHTPKGKKVGATDQNNSASCFLGLVHSVPHVSHVQQWSVKKSFLVCRAVHWLQRRRPRRRHKSPADTGSPCRDLRRTPGRPSRRRDAAHCYIVRARHAGAGRGRRVR